MLTSLLLTFVGNDKNAHSDRETKADWSSKTERELVAALKSGDESAFSWAVKKYWKSMERVAKGLMRNETAASEVVQDAWESVFKDIGNFRGDASLKNWIFRILVNRAKKTGKKESRSISLSDAFSTTDSKTNADLLDEFTPSGGWNSPVMGWQMLDPQNQIMNSQGLKLLAKFLEELPENQKVVVTLRDVEGLDSKEVRSLLDLSEANQRVLLHRGRTALRQALENAEKETN